MGVFRELQKNMSDGNIDKNYIFRKLNQKKIKLKIMDA